MVAVPPGIMQQMIARLALQRPEMLAQLAASKGLQPPARPDIPGAMPPTAAAPTLPQANPNVAPLALPGQLAAKPMVPAGMSAAPITPPPFAGGGPAPAFLPAMPAAGGMAGAPGKGPMAGPGAPLGDIGAMLAGVGQPSTASSPGMLQAPAPSMGNFNPEIMAIVQQMLGQQNQTAVPSLGSFLLGRT